MDIFSLIPPLFPSSSPLPFQNFQWTYGYFLQGHNIIPSKIKSLYHPHHNLILNYLYFSLNNLFIENPYLSIANSISSTNPELYITPSGPFNIFSLTLLFNLYCTVIRLIFSVFFKWRSYHCSFSPSHILPLLNGLDKMSFSKKLGEMG